MVKKVVDSRVHTLIKNCVQTKHRSFFVVVGDKGKDQVNLHSDMFGFLLIKISSIDCQFALAFIPSPSHFPTFCFMVL
jgi:hypothetical protein